MPALDLTSQEELALRQLGSQSISVAPNGARLLVRLALAEPHGDGWRFTPLGMRLYQALPKSPLQGGKPPPVIDNILNRAIPLARAAGILTATPNRSAPDVRESRNSCAGPSLEGGCAREGGPLVGRKAMIGAGAVACAGAALLLMGNKNIPLYERADAAWAACTHAGAELAVLWGASKRLVDDCFAPGVTPVFGQPGKLIVTRTGADTHKERSTYSVMIDGRGTEWRVIDVRLAPSNLSLDASLLATQDAKGNPALKPSD